MVERALQLSRDRSRDMTLSAPWQTVEEEASCRGDAKTSADGVPSGGEDLVGDDFLEHVGAHDIRERELGTRRARRDWNRPRAVGDRDRWLAGDEREIDRFPRSIVH